MPLQDVLNNTAPGGQTDSPIFRLLGVTPPGSAPDFFRTMQLSNALHHPQIAEQMGVSQSYLRNILMSAQPPESILEEYERMREQYGEEALSEMILSDPSAWFTPETFEQEEGPVVYTPEPGAARLAGPQWEEFADKVARISDIVTWPTQAAVMGVNTIYDALRPGRAIPRGDFVERLGTAFAGADWEPLHPDVQSVLWEGVRMATNPALETGLNVADVIGYDADALASLIMGTGNPELANQTVVQKLLLGVLANRREVSEVMSGEPITLSPEGEPVNKYGMLIPETLARQFITESIFDPFIYLPGVIRPRRIQGTPVIRPKVIEHSMVDPVTGELFNFWTELPTGELRYPTLGEYMGYGWNQMYNRVRGALDPFGDLRRSALRAYGYGGAEAVVDLSQGNEWKTLTRVIAEDYATRNGVSIEQAIEEVNRANIEIIEEIVGSSQFSLRNRSSMRRPELTTAIPSEEARIIELSRIDEPFRMPPREHPTVGGIEILPREQQRLFGETPELVRGAQAAELPIAGIPEAGGQYNVPGYVRPRGAVDEFIPGVTERPVTPEIPGQMQLLATAEERTAIIDDIVGLQTERFRRGSVPVEPQVQVYEQMTMAQLERTQQVINNEFINENIYRLAGVRGFQRAVRTGAGMRGATLEMTGGIIRESFPGMRTAPDEAILSQATLLYELAHDSLNVGPRAPLMRERLAGIMNEPLYSHLGYIKHIPDEAMLDAFTEAARRSGYTVDAPGEAARFMRMPRTRGPMLSNQRVANELGGVIQHESTRARGFRGSMRQGNELAADGRVWFEPSRQAGDMPTLHILEEFDKATGVRPGIEAGSDWVRVDTMFNTDLPTLLVNRRLAGTRAIEGTKYLDEVMELFGDYRPAGRPQMGTSIYDLEGMVDRTGAPTQRWAQTFGKLSPEIQEKIINTYFPDADFAGGVLRHFEISQGRAMLQDMIGAERIWWSLVKQYNKYFKAKTLFPFMKYHLRNWYDDGARVATWFEEWNPGDITDSFNTIMHGEVPQHVREYLTTLDDIPGIENDIDKLLYYMRGERVFESGLFYDEVANSIVYNLGEPNQSVGLNAYQRLKNEGFLGTEEGWLHHPANVFSTNAYWDQMGKELGRDGNNILRLSAAYAGMRKPGASVGSIGERVRMALIDYLDIDPLTQKARLFSPFITFQRHAIPLNVRALFERPGRVEMRLRAFSTIDQSVEQEYGPEQPPGWSGAAYRVGEHLWFIPENFDSIYDIGDILSTFSRLVGGDRAAGAEFAAEYLGPWVTEPIEQVLNYDMYRDGAIYNRYEGEEVPQILLDIGLSERAMTHLYHGITSTWRAARETEGYIGMTTGQRESSLAEWARRAAGVPLFEAQPGQTQHFLLRDNRDALEHIGLKSTYGTWQVYGIDPDRYQRAGELLSNRIGLHFDVAETMMVDPWSDEARPYLENMEIVNDYNRNSQETMLRRLQADIRGILALQDQYRLDDRATGSLPFNQAEIDWLNKLNQTIIMTRIALIMKAVEDGEISAESGERRIQERYESVLEAE